MSVEVIRDVVIRTKIDVQKDNPFERTERGTKSATQSADKLGSSIIKTGEAYQKAGQQGFTLAKRAGDATRQRAKDEENLTRAIQKRGTAEKQAATGGGLQGVNDKLDGIQKPIDTVGRGLSIASAAVAILNVSDIAISVANGSVQFVDALTGANTEKTREQGDSIINALNRIAARPLASLLGRKTSLDILDSKRASPENIAQTEVNARQRQIDQQKELLDVVKQRADLELGLQREQIQWTKQRETMLRQQVDLERERLQAGREQFGLLNGLEQKTAFDVAKKLNKGGVGSLSKEEMGFAQRFDVFDGAISRGARKNADAGGFAELLKLTGGGAGLAQAQNELENFQQNEVKFANELKIVVDGRDQMIERMVTEIRAELQEQLQAKEDLILAKMKRNQMELKYKNPGF